jgi:hypothetical protein
MSVNAFGCDEGPQSKEDQTAGMPGGSLQGVSFNPKNVAIAIIEAQLERGYSRGDHDGHRKPLSRHSTRHGNSVRTFRGRCGVPPQKGSVETLGLAAGEGFPLRMRI